MKKEQLCPQLHLWRQVYVVLEQAREQAGNAAVPPPPSVCNMQGWMLSDDLQKQRRWQETRAWAEQYGFLRLIPELADDAWYEGE